MSKKHPGITRYDPPTASYSGYFVYLMRRRKVYTKTFADKNYGGKRKALQAAKDYYSHLIEKHPGYTRRQRAERKRSNNASGIIGVCRSGFEVNGKKYEYWVAHCMVEKGKRFKKVFSVSKYGEEKARKMAIKARKEALKTMEA